MSEPPKTISIKSEGFHCDENGLRTIVEGYAFDPNVAKYLLLATPKLIQKGTVAKRQPVVQNKSGNYWKAQCIFRGLPKKGAIKILQEQIRDALDRPMDPEFAAVEARIKQEYKTQKDDRWRTLLPEDKMTEDSTRWLKEHFYNNDSKVRVKEVLVVKTASKDMRQSLHIAAENLALDTESTDAPYNEDGSKPDPSKWILVSHSRSAIVNMVREISREFSRSAQRATEITEEWTRKLNKKMESKALKTEKDSCVWDITGNWKIRCEELEDYDPNSSAELSIDFYSSSSSEGKEIWGIFDFGIITGVMRFIGESRASKDSNSGSSKRKRVESEDEEEEGDDDDNSEEDQDEDEDEDEENDDSEEEDDDPAFILPKSATPSPKNPTWKYRWRLEEKGEAEIQIDSDQHILSMTFGGPGGSRLKGIFRCEYIGGDISFTGKKVGEGEGDTGGSAYEEWCERSEAAHDRTRRGRWD